MSELLRKLMWLTQRGRKEAELRAELQFHLEEESAGNPAPRRELGNVALVMEDARAAWGWPSAESLWQDIRYAVRNLRRTPAFSAAAIVSLALGIGATTAIFSLLQTVVFRTLPVPKPQKLVQFSYTLPLYETNPNNWNSWFGYPQFERFRDESKTMAGIFGGTRVGRVNVESAGSAGLAILDAYTDSFFTVLGLTPSHGRLFAAGEDGPNANVAVISHSYWRNRFGSDPSIAGREVTVNRVPFTIMGVTPAAFTGISLGSPPDMWVPMRAMDRLSPGNTKRWTDSFTSWMLIAGRLRDGVTRQAAEAEIDVLHHRQLEEQLAVSELRNGDNLKQFVRESRLLLRPADTGVYSGLRNTYALPLRILMGVAGLVLLVACANLANLLLARASSRRREIAVRLALGAGRTRIVRQLFTESLVLAAIGGVVALALAWGGGVALVQMISTGDSVLPLDVTPDWRVFAFSAFASLAAAVLFGLAPALRASRVNPGPAIKEDSRQSGGRTRFLERALVVAQVALSVALVTGAGLFVRTFQNLWNLDLGYNRENVLMFSVDARLAGYTATQGGRIGNIYREILEKLRAIPGAQSVSASTVRPVDDHFYLVDRVNEIDGRALSDKDSIKVAWNAVSPGYFSTVSTPLVAGRDFAMTDTGGAAKVAIVNESLARRAFPNQNPLGHRLGLSTIVGVVKDSRYNGARDEPRPVLFHPLFQYGSEQAFRWGFTSYEIRSAAGISLLEQARREVASVESALPLFRVKTLTAQVAESMLKERLLATLSTFFGALALLLACVGLSGLMAYNVARRTPEIGIRSALGASRGQVVWLVQGEALVLTLAGIAIGIPIALFGAQYAKTLLFEIGAADPVAIAVTIFTLIAAAAVAAYFPIRRALRIDPASALRYE